MFRRSDGALRQDARTRNALSTRRPGLGRTHRLGPRAGQELAARLLRRARPQRRPCRRARLAIGARARSSPGSSRSTSSARRRPWRRPSPTTIRPIRRSPGISRTSSRGPQRSRRPHRRCGRTGSTPTTITTKGAHALNDYARANDPFAKIGKEQVSVDVASVIRASDTSFRVDWVERHYVNDALSATERWSAILTIVVQPPTDADRLRKNPLGIYVHAINWSKELG